MTKKVNSFLEDANKVAEEVMKKDKEMNDEIYKTHIEDLTKEFGSQSKWEEAGICISGKYPYRWHIEWNKMGIYCELSFPYKVGKWNLYDGRSLSYRAFTVPIGFLREYLVKEYGRMLANGPRKLRQEYYLEESGK